MYFKRIDMHGFKSFAEPVTIEFHEGITCIVGPNGSGKSNISDAIRWVLGEQSPKMLRGGKMEEVIFAGTANRKSRGMAEVTLVIDNKTGILPIDYSEVAITRRMYRSGESEYSINNNQCRLKDIRELIMDTGIGVDGYSLIGQGKIADIVSNKPESRREIFEEAAGIVKYRTKKAESEKKLESSNSNLERVNDIISEIETRIDGLKEDSEKAKEYIGLRDKYKELEINVTLKNIENIELKNEYIKDDLADLESKISELKDEKATIDTDIIENRERNEELGRLGNEVRDKLLINVETISSLVNRNQLNKEKLTVIGKDNQRLSEEIAIIDVKLEKEFKNADELHINKSNIDKELAGLETDLKVKIDRYADITGSLSAAAEDIDYNKNKIYELNSTIRSKQTEITSLSNLQETLLKRKEQILTEKANSEAVNKNISEAHILAVNDQISVKNQLEKIISENQAQKQKYDLSLVREKNLSRELEELKISIGQISTRKKMIEEMENSYEGYNNAVKFIMKSNLSGINGVVADLIEVPNGFETAIETALGAALQNIVCEDDKCAQNAIQYLKENKAGRLTFLPVKSMKPSVINYDKALTNAQGFRGFGVQCIKYNPKYQTVMEYLLGRVVIVDRLDHAVSLSKTATGGLRFVTLEGEVINSGGAITGGTFRNNTNNLLERKKEAKQLGEKLAEMIKSREEKVKELEVLRQDLSNDMEIIRKLEKDYRNTELDLLSIENKINLLSGQLADINLSEEKWAKELENISHEENASQAMIEEIKLSAELIGKEILEVETAIEKGLTKYEDQKARLEEINEEITKARIAVGTAENEKNNVYYIISRVEGLIQELKEEKQKKEESLSNLDILRESLQSGETDLETEIKLKEAEKTALENYLEEIQQEKEGVVKYLNEITQKKDYIDEILAKYQSQKYELEIKQAKNETQLDSYKDKLWEEFEVSYIQAIEYRKKDFVLSTAIKESREIKNRMKELGEVNIGAIKEYETVKDRYEFLTEQRSDILTAMNSLKQIINDMDKTIKQNFKDCFDKIVLYFEGAFKELFGGGTAELRLEDENNPLECGIEIVAQPPGKKLQNINLMSGGEKTMTAIALMFAILKAKPTPFCILDEVEAALDEANIDRFARYLLKFNEIQFTLVTHQKATMEYADILYGVTMPEQGISKVISLKLGDAFEI